MTGLLVLVVLSCAASRKDLITPEPDWLSSPPADPDFYFGVGGAHTGDQAQDRENALARARADLAASISVDVVSVLELKESVNKDGVSIESLENRVKQSVEQSLMNLQTVETWFHPDKGVWVLVRMNKRDWEKQRQDDRRVSVPVPGGLEELSGLNVSFLVVLENKKLPLKLLPGGKNTPYEMTLDWSVSDYPLLDENEGLHFSRVSGVVSFKQYGLILFSREYGPVKEGGLSYEQARERASQKVLELFREDSDFNRQIINEIETP